MILSDKDIKKFLKEGKLVIEPLLDPETQIQPSSVDLRLSSEFRIFKSRVGGAIDPKKDNPEEFTERVLLKEGESFVLHPGEFVLGATVERVELPDDLVGRVEGRSSWGRLAILVHATAGYIDPGFKGHITLELTNVGKLPVILYPGMRICQISFEMLFSPAERPYGHEKRKSKYQEQKGTTPSKVHLDRN